MELTRKEIEQAVVEMHFTVFGSSDDFDNMVRNMLLEGFPGISNMTLEDLLTDYGDYVVEDGQSAKCQGRTVTRDNNGYVTIS